MIAPKIKNAGITRIATIVKGDGQAPSQIVKKIIVRPAKDSNRVRVEFVELRSIFFKLVINPL